MWCWWTLNSSTCWSMLFPVPDLSWSSEQPWWLSKSMAAGCRWSSSVPASSWLCWCWWSWSCRCCSGGRAAGRRRGGIAVAALAATHFIRHALVVERRRIVVAVHIRDGAGARRWNGTGDVVRHLNRPVFLAADGQLHEVSAIHNVRPLPAIGTDAFHGQRLAKFSRTQTDSLNIQVPFLRKLFAAVFDSCAAD